MKTTLKGNILTIEIELDKDSKSRSKSGKSTLAYTSSGFKPIDGTDLKVSINVIGKRITA